jgi:hypothetical protein
MVVAPNERSCEYQKEYYFRLHDLIPRGYQSNGWTKLSSCKSFQCAQLTVHALFTETVCRGHLGEGGHLVARGASTVLVTRVEVDCDPRLLDAPPVSHAQHCRASLDFSKYILLRRLANDQHGASIRLRDSQTHS